MVGKKEKESIHLVNWKRIARPKKKGGWGLKTFFDLEKPWQQKTFG
jgi:hypothetical protein